MGKVKEERENLLVLPCITNAVRYYAVPRYVLGSFYRPRTRFLDLPLELIIRLANKLYLADKFRRQFLII